MVTVTTTLMEFLRRYRPGITREEAAVAAGISLATLARRLREGLNADEVMRAAQYVGASPVEALLELEIIKHEDVRVAAAVRSLEAVPDRTLIEELLARAIEREGADASDREEAGLPPSTRGRFEYIKGGGTVIDVAYRSVSEPDAEALRAEDPRALGAEALAARRGERDD